MNQPVVEPVPGRRPVYAVDAEADGHGHVHGVCWAAVTAGALGAASLSLILLILGVGLGLSSASPWSSEGISAETFGVSTIAWLTFTQLAASAAGGYLAGRLRTRWSRSVHTDEVYFRDTAHGFLAWSLATLITAGVLSAAVGNIISGGVKAGAAVGGTAVTAVATAAPAAAAAASGAAGGQGYYVDALFRKAAGAADPSTPASGIGSSTSANAASSPVAATSVDAGSTAEAVRIFANAVNDGVLPQDDARYLGQLVAQRAGLSQADAEKRVTDTFNRMQAKLSAAKDEAKAAADKARKTSAFASLWMFISLLIGAFVASFVATVGARHRDSLN